MRGAAIASLVMLVACGSPRAAAAQAVHSPTPSPVAVAASSQPTALPSTAPSPAVSPSPTPGAAIPPLPAVTSCSSTVFSGHNLAFVTLRGASGVIVRDITDLLHPTSVCSIVGGGSNFRFVDATHISYVSSPGGGGSSGALYVVDLTTQQTSLVRAWDDGWYGSWVYAWSPDGRALTYLKSDSAQLEWHLRAGGADRTLSRLGTIPPRDVSPDDDVMVSFSFDVQYVALEETFTYQFRQTVISTAPPLQIIRVSDGKLMYSRTDGTMAAWSGDADTFYFRSSVGVQTWDPQHELQTALAGVSWFHPWALADQSGRVTFSILDAQGNHRVELLDSGAAGGYRSLSSSPQTGQAVITPTLVWYEQEQACTPSQQCGFGGHSVTGTTFVYDLTTNLQTPSIITAVFDSWPHFLGQS